MPPVASTTAFAREQPEASALAVVGERARDAIAVLEQCEHGALHVHVDAPVDAVILQRADHLEPRAVADVREPRIAVAAEVALEDAAVRRAIEQRAPAPRARSRAPALPSRAARPCASC